MNSSFKSCIGSTVKSLMLLLIAAFLVVASDSAKATITTTLSVDLVATGGNGVSISGSNVYVTNGSTVNIQLWADVWATDFTSTSGTLSEVGVAGSILVAGLSGTNADGTFASGGVSTLAVDSMYKASNTQIGLAQDLNGDGALDLGGKTSSTSSNTQFIEARCDVGNSAYTFVSSTSGTVHNYQLSTVAGATFGTEWRYNPLNANSVQFLIGTLTWTVTNAPTDTTNPRVMQWQFPKFTGGAAGLMGMWGDNNVYHDSITDTSNGALSNSGQGLQIFAVVPEPGTWAMLVGGMGMLALGQRFRRRS